MLFNLVRLFQASPLLPRRLRAKVLKLAGLKIGRTVTVYEGAFFGSPDIGIGARSFINARCFFDTSARIEIGEDVHLAAHVQIYTSTHEIGPSNRRGGAVSSVPVRIGDGCWIGAGAMILPGADIADGCIVAAGAVVTQSTEENGLYGGTPARRLRDLI